MLTYSRLGAGGTRDDGTTELQIEVLRIQDTPRGGLRAQISTGGRRGRWYKEGEKFETFELLSIDEDAGCIDIYAENIRQKKTYCIE